MKKCKKCDYKFVRFYDDSTKAWFKCSFCGKTTQGYTNSFGEFLGKVKGKRQ